MNVKDTNSMRNCIDRIENGQFLLIAEIGVNYYDIAKKYDITNIEAAKLMIDEAFKAGIHAVKFQSYKADTLAVKSSPAYWNLNEESTKSQYELFKKYDSFGEREYRELSAYCKEIGIDFLSTPFDMEAVDYLEDIMHIYKISSSDLNNFPLVTYIAKKQTPILLSVGASNEDEIDRTIDWIRKYNDKRIVLLHCVLEYPTPYEDANLNKLISLRERHPDCVIGYSDHTKPDEGYEVIKTAYNLGARVIEKHFTLDKSIKGNDHYHAMDAKDASKIIKSIEYIDLIRGNYSLKCLQTEESARKNARRSIVARVNIPRGTIIKEDMLTFKRPGTGITVDRFEEIIGSIAGTDIAEDTVICESMLLPHEP